MHELEELAGQWDAQATRLMKHLPGQPEYSRRRDDIEARVLNGCAEDLRSCAEEIRQTLRDVNEDIRQTLRDVNEM